MLREAMLERIRAAAAAGARTASLEPPPLPASQVFPDRVRLFIERARQVSAVADVVASLDDAVDRAAAWCAGRSVRTAVAWNAPDLTPLVERLRASGVEILAVDSTVKAVAGADVGITGADWGIAETATLVLSTDPDRPRLTSLLPPAHVAIMRADRILPDLPALFARAGPLPSALTLITGPSRSADIGLAPVLGAHGPMAVAIFIVAG